MADDGKTDLHTIPDDRPEPKDPPTAQDKPAKRQTPEHQAEDRSNRPPNSDG